MQTDLNPKFNSNASTMMKLNYYPSGEPYEAPSLCVVPFEAGSSICETSGESEYVEPGTLDSWGEF